MDGDELPDADYESIYGAEALAARAKAKLDANLRRTARNEARLQQVIAESQARIARLDAAIAQLDARQRPASPLEEPS